LRIYFVTCGFFVIGGRRRTGRSVGRYNSGYNNRRRAALRRISTKQEVSNEVSITGDE